MSAEPEAAPPKLLKAKTKDGVGAKKSLSLALVVGKRLEQASDLRKKFRDAKMRDMRKDANEGTVNGGAGKDIVSQEGGASFNNNNTTNNNNNNNNQTTIDEKIINLWMNSIANHFIADSYTPEDTKANLIALCERHLHYFGSLDYIDHSTDEGQIMIYGQVLPTSAVFDIEWDVTIPQEKRFQTLGECLAIYKPLDFNFEEEVAEDSAPASSTTTTTTTTADASSATATSSTVAAPSPSSPVAPPAATSADTATAATPNISTASPPSSSNTTTAAVSSEAAPTITLNYKAAVAGTASTGAVYYYDKAATDYKMLPSLNASPTPTVNQKRQEAATNLQPITIPDAFAKSIGAPYSSIPQIPTSSSAESRFDFALLPISRYWAMRCDDAWTGVNAAFNGERGICRSLMHAAKHSYLVAINLKQYWIFEEPQVVLKESDRFECKPREGDTKKRITFAIATGSIKIASSLKSAPPPTKPSVATTAGATTADAAVSSGTAAAATPGSNGATSTGAAVATPTSTTTTSTSTSTTPAAAKETLMRVVGSPSNINKFMKTFQKDIIMSQYFDEKNEARRRAVGGDDGNGGRKIETVDMLVATAIATTMFQQGGLTIATHKSMLSDEENTPKKRFTIKFNSSNNNNNNNNRVTLDKIFELASVLRTTAKLQIHTMLRHGMLRCCST